MTLSAVDGWEGPWAEAGDRRGMESPGHRLGMRAAAEGQDLACQARQGGEILQESSCLVGHGDQDRGRLVVGEA